MTTQVAIVGGGATGLSLAWLLARRNIRVQLWEGAAQVGGLLGGFSAGEQTLEYYYHHFFTHDRELRHLLACLNLSDKAFFFKGSMGIYRGGALYGFSGPQDLLSLPFLSLPAKLRFALTSLYLSRQRDWKAYERTPALDWLRRYAGAQSVEAIWEPLFGIKFGPHAKDISLSWLIGRLSQRVRSREGADEKLGYILGSFQHLAEALSQQCQNLGVGLHTQRPLTGLAREGSHWVLQSGSEELRAEQVVLTLPTPTLRSLLAPLGPTLHEAIPQVHYFHAICMVLELTQSLSPYYWINVCDPGLPFGGIIEHTRGVPSTYYAGKHWVYLSRYHVAEDPLAQASAAELTHTFTQALLNMFPHFKPQAIASTHVFRTAHAAQICRGEFSNKVPQVQSPWPGLWISNMSHVYPDERSTNNALRVALATAKQLGEDVSDFPSGSSLAGQIGFNL